MVRHGVCPCLAHAALLALKNLSAPGGSSTGVWHAQQVHADRSSLLAGNATVEGRSRYRSCKPSPHVGVPCICSEHTKILTDVTPAVIIVFSIVSSIRNLWLPWETEGMRGTIKDDAQSSAAHAQDKQLDKQLDVLIKNFLASHGRSNSDQPIRQTGEWWASCPALHYALSACKICAGHARPCKCLPAWALTKRNCL